MKNIYKIVRPIIIAIFLVFIKCSSDSTSPTDPINTEQPGYKLAKYIIETELPSFVNILFQVSNMDDKGVTSLSVSNFELFEDGQPVSPSESQMEIINKANVYKLKTVLCLDNSSSVGSNLAQIKSAALTMINNLVPEQEVAIYKFSENPILIQDFTKSKSDLISAINGIELGFATTNLYGTIIEGVSKWEDAYRLDEITQGFLVVLTDGRDTQGSSTLAQALSARGNKKVYTIGLGSEIDASILTQLGNAGSYSINDINQLSQLFGNIQEEMKNFSNSFYWLRYLSPTRGNNIHQLELKIKGNQNTSSNYSITGSFNSSQFTSKLLKLVDPIDGVIWETGTAYNITWERYGVSQIKIEYSIDNGANWIEIAVVSEKEIYNWSVPTQLTNAAKIRISDINDPNTFSTNDGSFLIKNPSHSIDFVLINSGPFTFGVSNETRTIDYSYEIMKYEVTVRDYLIYLYEAIKDGSIYMYSSWDVRGYYEGDAQNPPGQYSLFDFNNSNIQVENKSFRAKSSGKENHPVTGIRWIGAKLFAKYFGYDLPSEEEWEKAARGNTGWAYPWGDSIDGTRANYLSSGDPYDQGTTPVGFYNGNNGTVDSPSPFGAYDMAGNVWEWTSTPYPSLPSDRWIRGGGYKNANVNDLATYDMSRVGSSYGLDYLGFRCIKK